MTSSLTFVGNATTLLERDGFRVLTDPNFLRRGQRAYLGLGLSSKRLQDPALSPDQLPPLDAVALSHLHGDHYDRVARRGLDPSVPVLTTPSGATRLRTRRVEARGLTTWESWETGKDGATLRVTALPGRHAPGLAQLAIPRVMGTLMEFERPGQRPYRVYQSGDTLVRDDLREIVRRYPEIDLALVHLGGTRILGLTLTMDGRMGADLLELLELGRRGTTVVPVHYEEYPVFRSPLSEFREELDRRGLQVDVRWVGRGETLAL
ncbi:L-ascorbate metabolism protein UlaG (beta-lactamase superfamily) [Motilibacter rhizosphaerae]|uniref:L-ascorbate metabolism protein UlaG (Beta-lactamase superfamily) n=1 Tax=Motilibacter rhizosphaerae TaxID=598652 RepID=A0A4Q7NRR4_9ACTN|nr:MBL fold metallo-hydrolase [Motilibacter rhizosphaerae]RZS89767.1 L-ascorbate metabolism protein UlaG (beta-lactamase superfamily) [Motilibacter rhizosphaerae]